MCILRLLNSPLQGGRQLQTKLNGQQEPGHMLVAHTAASPVLGHGPVRDDPALPRGHRADHDRPAPLSVPGARGFCHGVRTVCKYIFLVMILFVNKLA